MSETTPRDLSKYGFLSLGVGVVVLTMKLVAWQVTGSVGLLSDALESLVNIAAAIVAIFALRTASRPPDQRHQFGHGKAEYFSGLVEGGMICVAATLIIISATERLFDPQPLEEIGLGLAIAIMASGLNALTAVVLLRVGRRENSLALTADAHHLFTDLWTTGGVVLGVVVVSFSGWNILDPLIAMAVAVNIVVVGVRLLRASSAGLMDSALPGEQVQVLRDILSHYQSEDVVVHGLQTRRAGRQAFVSMHVLVPGSWDVMAGHDLCHRMEEEIQDSISGVEVTTHLEPLEDPRAWNDTHEGQHPLD
ncbi:MAG: cation-efflux pump [Micrococcales bacterium]|nr:cation-efflux pump [Micrococcales bacterium]